MVTFTEAMLQTRQTAVFLHLLYKLGSFTTTACLLACFLPSLIACRFSTSLSARCFNFASAIQNIHAVSNAVFHLFEFQPLSLLVLHPSAERNFTVDATTSLCAWPILHLVEFISDDARQLFSFVQLLYRTSLHYEIGHRSVRSLRIFWSFFAVHLLSNYIQHYEHLQLTRW
jgi:hypothetical protein